MQFIPLIITAVSALSSMSKGQEKSQQYEVSQKTEEYNAALSRQKADVAMSAANQREETQRRAARLIQGKQRAAIAESGLGLGGTNADLESQSELFEEMDAMNIRYRGTLEAKGLLADANLADYRARSYGESSSKSLQGGYLGAAGSLLGGIGDYVRLGRNSEA